MAEKPVLTVVILGLRQMFLAWFKRRCTMLDGSTGTFDGRHPFRAFHSAGDGCVYYFAPFAPRELRAGLSWLPEGLYLSMMDAEVGTRRQQGFLRGANHGLVGRLAELLRKDRATLFLHEAVGHGLRGQDHADAGLMALPTWTRIKTTPWGEVAKAWPELVDYYGQVRVVQGPA